MFSFTAPLEIGNTQPIVVTAGGRHSEMRRQSSEDTPSDAAAFARSWITQLCGPLPQPQRAVRQDRKSHAEIVAVTFKGRCHKLRFVFRLQARQTNKHYS